MRKIFILSVTALLGLGLGPALSAQDAATLVEIATVEERVFHNQLTLVGRTAARAESRVVAEVAGRVRSVDVGEGQRVRRGAPLAQLDCRRIALSLEAKEAEAGQARAQAELAEKELERARELVSTSVFPQRNLDSAAAEAARAAEYYRQLEAERRYLELDRESCRISAPFDGYTVRKLIDVGEWVEAGTPVYEMVDLAVVQVYVDLPEKRFGELEIGSPVVVEVANGESWQGEVRGIAPNASETTHTFPVIVGVDNPDGRLAGGMLVRAHLRLRGTFEHLGVSKDAVVRQDGLTVVYTVNEDIATRTPVRVLAQDESFVAIEALSGSLNAGQAVVVRGNERIFDGSPVRIAGKN